MSASTKKTIGRSRADNLDWLTNVWLEKGPPVAFLQGFPGVGKTTLAHELLAQAEKRQFVAVIDEVANRPTPSILDSLLELADKLSEAKRPEMHNSLLDAPEPQEYAAIKAALGKRTLIVLDESQRLFAPDSGLPLPELSRVLERLQNEPRLPGRLLLLSDRRVELGRIWFPVVRRLDRLTVEEAWEVFEDRLRLGDVKADIPADRRHDLMRELDCNPRALEALATSLEFYTLDEIIERHPGMWQLATRQVDRAFLERLEADLLRRTLERINERYREGLKYLSVHRKPFQKAALENVERLHVMREKERTLRDALGTRFLLHHHNGWFSLNPIAREIAVAWLSNEASSLKAAHALASDYHLRHFEPREITARPTKLAESFAELRYHLVHAEKRSDLSRVAGRMSGFLRRQIRAASPVPSDPGELEERIGVLSALLETEGAKGLEYHLARCLEARGRPEDLHQAVEHARRATGPRSPTDAWLLRMRLEGAVLGIDRAMRTVRQVVGSKPPPDNLSAIYQLGASLLAGADKTAEAVALLREGIGRVPSDRGLVSLYQFTAELLERMCNVDEALGVVSTGVQSVPADKGAYALFQIGAEILERAGRSTDALALIGKGLTTIPPNQSLFSLYRVAADILVRSGRIDDAVTMAKAGVAKIPPEHSVVPLYQKLAELHCRANAPETAVLALRDGFRRIGDRNGGTRLAEAALCLTLAIGPPLALQDMIDATGADALGPATASLARVLRCYERGEWIDATQHAAEGRNAHPTYLRLALQYAFALLANGDAEGARDALVALPALRIERGDPQAWLLAFIHLRRRDLKAATNALTRYLGRTVDTDRELNEAFLLALWDEQHDVPNGHRVCFEFPILPPSLSGLRNNVRRVQFAAPVLPVDHRQPIASAVAGPRDTPIPSDEPDAYVSYAWGEDSEPEGRCREQLVDELCDTLSAQGRAIARDKHRMKAGNSVREFTQQLSRSRRIVAVISERSLRSEYCMAEELFTAYRRCDFSREEFRMRVIALVMDDAIHHLHDPAASVRLANDWLERSRLMEEDLRRVDPDHTSEEEWRRVKLVKDMCPRLPDMLSVLRDTIMPQGFEQIRANGFREVLARLET